MSQISRRNEPATMGHIEVLSKDLAGAGIEFRRLDATLNQIESQLSDITRILAEFKDSFEMELRRTKRDITAQLKDHERRIGRLETVKPAA